jgi:hypothetical protein
MVGNKEARKEKDKYKKREKKTTTMRIPMKREGGKRWSDVLCTRW